MNGHRRHASACACLVFMIGLSSPVASQVLHGEILGTVSDESGAVLPGVSVTIAGGSLIQPRTAVTADGGGYRFPAVPVGTYTVSFELTGFKKLIRQGIVIQAGFNAEIDARLEISTVEETVTVAGASPVVDTMSTTHGLNFGRDLLDAIPTARDPWVIIEQTPGLVMAVNKSAAGTRDRWTATTRTAAATTRHGAWTGRPLPTWPPIRRRPTTTSTCSKRFRF